MMCVFVCGVCVCLCVGYVCGVWCVWGVVCECMVCVCVFVLNILLNIRSFSSYLCG